MKFLVYDIRYPVAPEEPWRLAGRRDDNNTGKVTL